jgi:predicted aspartyl protease
MNGFRTAAWIALASVAGCDTGAPASVRAPADSAAGEVPLEMAGVDGTAVLVAVHINGRGPFDFVLDTGATVTCIDSPVAQQLELPAEAGNLGFGADVSGTGRVQMVGIDSLRLGRALAADLTACVLELEHIRALGIEADGLLGLDFLKQFHVAIDFDRGVLHLTAP